jgi:4-amino-4-deoxy-L-arabinose transferase-like glycosyltransferase
MTDVTSRIQPGHLIILLLLGLALFFFRLGDRPLWDTDEGMHAATSKDMVVTGDYITPRLNGETFYDKPVLFNWLAAASFRVFGFTEFAARLPAAILGLGSVLLTYFLGRRMFNATVGLFGGVILATSIEYIILSRVVVHDIALVFCMTLALYSLYRAFESEPRRTIHLMIFYASLGFAVLAKGPLGLLLPALIVGLFLLMMGRLTFLKEMRLGWGIVVFLLIAAPWYVLIMLRNPDYAGYFFLKQNLMNFISAEARHPRPFYYYFHILAGGFFPWSFLLPLALIHGVRRRSEEHGVARLYLLLWLGVVFVFFSTASSKLSPYILPLFPAAALLVGDLWHALLKAPTTGLRRGFVCSLLPLLIIFLVGLITIWINPLTRLEYKYGIDLIRINALVFLMSACIVVAFFLLLRRHYAGSFSTLAGMVVAAIVYFMVLVVPAINPYRSTKGLAATLDAMLPPGEDMVFFVDLRDSALFYTNRLAVVLLEPERLMERMSSDKQALCVIDRKHFEHLEDLQKMVYVIETEGSKLLISNKRPGYQPAVLSGERESGS